LSKKGRPPAPNEQGIPLLELFESTAPWKRGLTVVITLVIVLCALVPELVFQNGIFLVPDTKAPLSFATVGKEALDSGTYPLWNPYLFCGMPSYQSLAYTPYVYPPSFVTHILQAYLGFPEMTWLLIHYIMAGIGVYLLVRSLGGRASVSLLAGVVFMILPNFIAVGANGHGSQVCATAYMPFAILCARNILRGFRRVPMTAFLSIILGFQMLRGHIQISYYTFLLIGLLFLYQFIHLLRSREYRFIVINIVFMAIAFVAAVGIAAVLILPIREYAALSIRGGVGGGLDYGYATGWSLHPKEMLTFILPWAYGFGKVTYWGEMPFTDYPNYLGAVPIIFCMVALFLVQNRWKWFLALTALLATVISFGQFFPVLYNPMFKFLPYFNKFRVPVMILIVQQLALVVLLGLGLEAFLSRYREGNLPRVLQSASMKWILIALVALFVILLVSSDGIRTSIAAGLQARGRVGGEWAAFGARSFANDLLKRILLFAAVALIFFLSSTRRVLPNTLVLIFAAIAIVDIFTVSRAVIHPEKVWKAESLRIVKRIEDRSDFLKPDEVERFLQGDPSYFRIFPVPAARPGNWSYSTPPFSDNRFMIHRIFSLGGYHAAKLKSYQDIMDVFFASFNRGIVPIKILDMLNTKYLVSPFRLFREGSPFPLEWNEGNTYIYRNPSTLPRVFLVDTFRGLPPDEVLRSLVSPDFDPSREVLLQEEPSVAPVSAEGSRVSVADYRLNSITIEAQIEEPCIMVLSEIAYPAWKVTVNGREAPIMTANYCLRALALRPGNHEVLFWFSSSTLNISLIISIVIFVLAITVPAVYWLVVGRRG